MRRALLALATLSIPLAHAATDQRVAEAATRFAPSVSWDRTSVLKLNFTCRGRTEYAILGVTLPEEVLVEGRPVGQKAPELVVAVFVAGLEQPPKFHQDSKRGPEFAKLSVESLNLKKSEIVGMAGAVPEGFRPSRTCKGLRLSDEQTDSVHLYWNHVRGEISGWSL